MPPAPGKKRSAAQKLALAKGRIIARAKFDRSLSETPSLGSEQTLSVLTEKLSATEEQLQTTQSTLQVAEVEKQMQQLTLESTERELEAATKAAETTSSKNASLYKALHTTRLTLQRAVASKATLKDKINLLETVEVPAAKQNASNALHLLDASTQAEENLSDVIDKLMEKLQVMDVNLKDSKKHVHALEMRCTQAPEIMAKKIAQAEEKVQQQKKELHLVQKGVYTPEARTLARMLTHAGCTKHYVGAVIKAVCDLAGVSVDAEMSSRTVGRAIIEGGVAAEMQLGYEIAMATDIGIGMDGTTERHINVEAKYIHVGRTDEHGKHQHKTLLLGVDPAVDHKSETQIAGWLSKLKDIADVFGSSPLAQRQGLKLLIDTLIAKLRAMHSDHAKDQKKTYRLFRELKAKLCYETLGAEKLVEMTEDQLTKLM